MVKNNKEKKVFLPVLGLATKLDELLPQIQCRKCGYSSCFSYAKAMANTETTHDRCIPIGIEGSKLLASTLKTTSLPPLEEAIRIKRSQHMVAFINEEICIGCTICIQTCPVDAIVGASRQMHTVLHDWCTGCELCVESCPVNCISMKCFSKSSSSGNVWSQQKSDASRQHFAARNLRINRINSISNRNKNNISQVILKKVAHRLMIRTAFEKLKARKEATFPIYKYQD